MKNLQLPRAIISEYSSTYRVFGSLVTYCLWNNSILLYILGHDLATYIVLYRNTETH